MWLRSGGKSATDRQPKLPAGKKEIWGEIFLLLLSQL